METGLGMPPAEASPTKVYERWSENFWPDLFALAGVPKKLWVPATAMNLGPPAGITLSSVRKCWKVDVGPSHASGPVPPE